MQAILYKRFIALGMLMFAASVFLFFIAESKPVSTKKPLSTFPKTIGGWNGKESFFSQEIYEEAGVDDSTLINYRNSGGQSVELYIGYYSSQSEGDIIHSPKNCLPGSGWGITETATEELLLPDGKNCRVAKLMLEKGAGKQMVLYWYHSRGRVINSEYFQKLFLVTDSIFRQRTDGSFIRLSAPVINPDENHTLDYLKNFALLIMPYLSQHIPE